ncbi:MAG: hypothetical protein Fur0011_3020 [Candidatus Microgenomates bacterium]
MKEERSYQNHEILEKYYIGYIRGTKDLLPLLRRLSIVDPHNISYTLRYITLDNNEMLFYLDHSITNSSCTNQHHVNILKSYQKTNPDAIPVDGGYLEFKADDKNVILLARTASTLQEQYQLRFNSAERKITCNILNPVLEKINMTCITSTHKSAPPTTVTEYYD